VIARWIDWCAKNRFLVSPEQLLLVLRGNLVVAPHPARCAAGYSDVQVIIHTRWAGQPPSLIEDQVTYPIVTKLLAAPHVKAVRAQTMLGDSYVFVVFEDGTDLYWARSRFSNTCNRLKRTPGQTSIQSYGPDATGAVGYNTFLWTTRITESPELRSIHGLVPPLSARNVPGVAKSRPSGDSVKQYQVNVDANKLRALQAFPCLPSLRRSTPARMKSATSA